MKPQMVDKSVDATILVMDEGIQARPHMVDMSVSPIEDQLVLPPSPQGVISAITTDAAVQTTEDAGTQAVVEETLSVEPKADPEAVIVQTDISTDLVGSVEIPHHIPQPTPTNIEEPVTRPVALGGGVFSLVRDACVTVPIYVSLVVFKTTLSMMGARDPASAPSRTRGSTTSNRFVPSSMNFSPVCI